MTEILVPAKSKKNRRFYGKLLTRSLIYAFALFGILFILLLLAVIGLIRQDASAPANVPQRAVLTVDFDEAFNETRQDNLLSDVSGGNPLSFNDLLMVLDAAAKDARIQALAGRIHVSGLGLAQMQELFAAVKAFRAAGKPAYLFAPGFGNFGGGTSEYYLATAFGEITMLPGSDLGLTGIYAEVPFFKNILDKVGAKAEFFTRYEYKNAMASLTEAQAPKPLVRSMQTLVALLNLDVLSAISAERFPDARPSAMMSFLDKAPLPAEQAKQEKLIDKIAYEGDWMAEIKDKHQAEPIDLLSYSSNVYRYKKAPYVAVLVLDGLISDGDSIASPLGDAVVGSRSILRQLEEIRKIKGLKAVVVRINSPGGSYAASNEIRHALIRLKQELNVPLYVSMGNYAASGGYFIALAGDKIYADRSTITGSIGVLGGKFSIEALWKKLGVSWKVFDVAETSGINSVNFSFNKVQKDIINKSLDRIYKDFTLKVSQARNISLEKLDKVARGRVLTGSEAREEGLVDEIGGFYETLGAVAAAAGIGKEQTLSVLVYPKEKTLQEKISEVLNSAPLVKSSQIKAQLGLDISEVNVLKRLQYDAVMPPAMLKH